MKFKTLVMSLAVVGMLFTACNDSKKKEEQAKMEQEQAEMDAQREAEEAEAMEQREFEENTIAMKAMNNDEYSMLVDHLQKAELAETFKGEGEYTVFAPSNTAFEAVPKATKDKLYMAENKPQLQGVLKYHVVSGEWKAADLMKAIEDNNNSYRVTTLEGENLVLSAKDGKIMIKDGKGATATVTNADMDAYKGVIHGIDKVLMPKGKA